MAVGIILESAILFNQVLYRCKNIKYSYETKLFSMLCNDLGIWAIFVWKSFIFQNIFLIIHYSIDYFFDNDHDSEAH